MELFSLYDLIVRGVTALLFCFTEIQLPWLIINNLFTRATHTLKISTEVCNPAIFFNSFFSFIFSEFTGLTYSNGGSRMDSLPKKWGKSLLLFAFSLTDFANRFHSESRLLGLKTL